MKVPLLTYSLAFLCIALTVWNARQESKPYTVIEQKLLFVDPLQVGGPYKKILQGELWRCFSPAILHEGFFHVLFNMGCFFYLGRKVEAHLGSFRMLGLLLVLALFSNVMQCLLKGPYFLGFSGVILGLTAFIWGRKRIRPQEGYTLSPSFLCVLLGSALFSMKNSSIASVAHFSGVFLGYGLGRSSFFISRIS